MTFYNQSKWRVVGPSLNGYFYNTTTTHWAQGSLRKRGQRDSKRQKNSVFSMRLSSTNVRIFINKLPTHELNKDKNTHANVNGVRFR